jgi:hypothetical protein
VGLFTSGFFSGTKKLLKDKQFFIYLPLLSPTIPLLVMGMVYSFHGFDLTDESFVLLSIIHWRTSFFNSFFGLALYPIWQIALENLVFFRIVGFSLLWLSSAYYLFFLTDVISSTIKRQKGIFKYIVLASFIPSSYYISERIWTPNYNWAVLFCTLMLCGSCLALTGRNIKYPQIHGLIFFFASIGTVLAKPISLVFVALFFVALLLMRTIPDGAFSLRVPSPLTVLVFIVSLVAFINLLFLIPWTREIMFIYETMALFNSDSYSFGNILRGSLNSLRYGIFPYIRFLAPVIILFILVFSISFRASKLRRHFKEYLIVILIFCFSLSFIYTMYSYRNYSEFNRFGLLSLIFLVFFLVIGKDLKLLKVLALNVLLVSSFSFGSGNGVWPKSSGAMSIFMVSLLLCTYEFKLRNLVVGSKLFYLVLVIFSSLYIFAFSWMVNNPYRQALVFDQTKIVNIAKHGSIRLEPEIAKDIELFLKSLALNGMRRTDRLLNLTGLSNSHLLIFSQSAPPKTIFLMERSFPNAESVLRRNLSVDLELQKKNLALPWLVLPTTDIGAFVTRSQTEAILVENGIDIYACYREIYTSKLGYSIWHPVCLKRHEK